VPARPVPGGPGGPVPPGTGGTGAAGPSPVTDAGQVPPVPGDPTAGAPQSPPPSGGLVAQVRELATSLDRFWHLVPMGLVGLLSWSVWLVRRMLSRLYRPTVNYYRTSTSVVVPVYREDADVLERCLRSWLAEQPDEVVLVVDLEDRHLFERLAGYDHPALRVVPFQHRGKRSALGVGIREARHDVVVLADSDTEWEPGLLAAVQMPFVDPTVGGVGTRQTVYKRESGLWRRVASWLLNTRYLDYVPAMGRAGAVACLSGRTAAYRRSVILPRLPELEHERFLGRECVAGDDGRLTWLVLRSGYRTVYQANARARSMFPDTLGAFVKQRVRWSRNSYRCYLTAACTGWLWRQPFVTQMTVLQILLTPLSMGTSVAAVWFAARQPGTTALTLALLWLVAGRGIRGLSHLREHPGDVPLAPLVALVVLLIALPVKAYAFVTMNRQGWLTRHTDLIGGEGQSEASLFQGGANA
jgi:N-acetylglucosaminyltransferase